MQQEMEEIRNMLPQECLPIWDKMMSYDFMEFFTTKKKTLPIEEWKGHRLQPSFKAETVRYTYEDWCPRKGDVFVVAYPKTGCTWTTETVKQLLYFGKEKEMKIASNLALAMSLIEGGGPDKFKIFDALPLERRLLTTHLPAPMINVKKIKDAGAKVVYVLRNPKDQAVSFYKFIPQLPHLQIEPLDKQFGSDWPTFLDSFLSGKLPIGMKDGESYLDHIVGWLPHRDDKNVMFFYYEDMKEDPIKEFTRLAKFLNLDLTDENIQAVADKVEFSNMKKSTEQGSDGSMDESVRGAISLMRKGQVGGWKEQFTVAQSELMDKLVQEKLGNTDIRFKYD